MKLTDNRKIQESPARQLAVYLLEHIENNELDGEYWYQKEDKLTELIVNWQKVHPEVKID